MKLVCNMILVVFTTASLPGCHIPVELAMRQGMEASKTTTDADLATVVLEKTTTPDAFVEIAKTVSVKSGYDVKSVSGSGPVRIVMASKQFVDQSFQYIGSKRDSLFSSLTFQLDADGRTIQISLSVTSNLTGQESAKKITQDLKSQIQKLYAEKSSN